jgi:hypothetical protein
MVGASRPRVALSFVTVAVGALLGTSTHAQVYRMPPAAATGTDAQASLAERQGSVIQANACGREDEYLTFRTQMRQLNFAKQGEDLTSILIAKTRWLTEPALLGQSCVAHVIFPREVDPAKEKLPPEDDDRYREKNRESFRAQVLARYQAQVDATPAAERCRTRYQATAANAWEVVMRIEVDPNCMLRQVNESIRAMKKTAEMGTGFVCLSGKRFAEGDWDVNVRDLVRLLIAGRNPSRRGLTVLDPETVDHMYSELLAARGEPAGESSSVITDCDNRAGEELGSPEDTADRRDWFNEAIDGLGDVLKWLFETVFVRVPVLAASNAGAALSAPFMVLAGEDPLPLHVDIRVPESENHRLMIESSRYLTNNEIINYLKAIDYSNVDDLEDEQDEVRSWLLTRLNSIAMNDFVEYNSRPYTRYSLSALTNLFDFAPDDSVRTASWIVLDLSQAKFVAGSNRARRAPPFRRLADNDGGRDDSAQADFYNAVEGTDNEVGRGLVFYGQTQLLGDRLPTAGAASLIYPAVSGYAPPGLLFGAAVDRPAFRQQFAHAGVELYVQTPAYTMSAGGVRTDATGSTLGRSRDVDRGVAMPTLIIPTFGGTRTHEVASFYGTGSEHERSENLCVTVGFACGIQPRLGAAFSACLEVSMGHPDRFINSAKCAPNAPAFFLAAHVRDCDGRFCESGRTWGIFDIVSAPPGPAADPAFTAFKASRAGAFAALAVDGAGVGNYVTAGNDTVEFTVAEGRPRILKVNGQAPPSGTTGGLVQSLGTGQFAIGFGTGSLSIDVRDPDNPIRQPQ